MEAAIRARTEQNAQVERERNKFAEIFFMIFQALIDDLRGVVKYPVP